MKKIALIVAVVISYSLLETGLLLVILIASGYGSWRLYQGVVFWGQLALIPGSAAIMLRIMNGPHRTPWRALRILVLGIIGVPALVLLILSAFVLIDWLTSITLARGSLVFLSFLLAISAAALVAGITLLVRSMTRRTVEEEALRWQRAKELCHTKAERHRQIRYVRLVSWIPTSTVLFVFLFIPEIWGLLTYLGQPRRDLIQNYHVPIPATWIVLGHEDMQTNGTSWSTGLIGRGIALAPKAYMHPTLPFAEWTIGSKQLMASTPVPAPGYGTKARQIFLVGSDPLACVQLQLTLPNRRRESAILIECSSPSGLYANLIGDRNQAEAFYRVLGGITHLD